MTVLASMPKYGSYKDSGVEWLGDIPSEWNTLRVKYLFNEINNRATTGNEELLSVSQYTGVTKKSDKVTTGELLTNAESLEGYKQVAKGDLVSNIMLAWNGSLGFSSFDGITSPAYSVYRLQNNHVERYFHYLLRTDLYKAEFKRRSSGVIESRLRLYSDDFFDITSILPPIQEQSTIANFLDKKTTQIDEAIAIKQKQIELLRERKQIIIQKAVTQGLDPNVPMRDSEVDWIGEIPEHWGLKKLKHVSHQFMYGTSVDCNELEEGTPVLRIPNIKELVFNFDDLKYTSLTKQETARYKLYKDDILIIRTNGNPKLVGKSAIFQGGVDNDFMFASYLIRIRPQKNIESSFLIETLNSFSMRGSLTHSARTSAGNYNLNTQALGNCYLAYPPIKEQISITNFLYEEKLKFNEAIELQANQIQKLKEYKTTLINSAVTGKIKVPEMQFNTKESL